MADDRDGHEQSAEEQTPETAPERAARSPKLDPISNVIETDDFLFRMVSLADDAEVLHLESRCGQLFNRCFRRRAVGEDGNCCITDFHLFSFGTSRKSE